MPAEGTTYVSRPLSDLSLAYNNPMSVRNGPFPVKYVTKKKSSVYIMRPENLRHVNTGPRAYLEPAERSHWVPEPHPYSLDHHSLYDLIDVNHAMFDMDEVLDPSEAMTMTMTGQLMISAEVDARDKCFAAGAFNANYTSVPANKWDADNGDPISDLNDAALQVLIGCGMRANAVLLAGNVWTALVSNPKIVNRFQYVREGDLTTEQFAGLFTWLSPENVFVGDMVFDEANEGADADNELIWQDNCLVFRREAGMSNAAMNQALQIGFGRSFEYQRNRYVRQYKVENPEADAVYVGLDYDHNVTEQNAGFLFTAAVS